MIKESEFLQALGIINAYKKQVDELVLSARNKSHLNLTCEEFAKQRDMSRRLYNILVGSLIGQRIGIKDIKVLELTRKQFLLQQYAGRKTWVEFCDLTGRDSSENN